MSAEIWRKEAWWERGKGETWARWNSNKGEKGDWDEGLDRDASEGRQTDVDLEVFKVVVEHFRHNLEIFWQHYLLFLGIQGALITVFTGRESSHKGQGALVIFGILLSVYWGWVAWTRWMLIDRWREEVKRLDLEVDRHLAFFWVETHVRRDPFLIPAFSALLLPLLIAVGWIVLSMLH